VSTSVSLAAQIGTIRSLIEYREIAGPDLDRALRATLRTLEETQALAMHFERIALNRWGPPLDLDLER
jgi:hypothetical protein